MDKYVSASLLQNFGDRGTAAFFSYSTYWANIIVIVVQECSVCFNPPSSAFYEGYNRAIAIFQLYQNIEKENMRKMYDIHFS